MTGSPEHNVSMTEFALDDLQIKPWGEQPDYQLITGLLNQSMMADGIDHLATPGEMENYYSKLPEFSPLEDAFIAWVDGEALGWVSLQPRRESKGDMILRHYVALKDEWRGQGIRALLLEKIEARAAERVKRIPPAQVTWLEASMNQSQSRAIALLEEKGYQPTRYFFFMTRSLEEPIEDHPLPADFHQRAVTEDDLRPIWDAHQQAFSEHWGHSVTTEEHFQMFLEDPLTDPSLWQIAWHGDEVAGMVLNFLDADENEAMGRQRGYTENIAVAKPFRQRGLAKALITKSMRMFIEMGMTEAALSVDTENPSGALNLYQGLGYSTDRKSVVYRKQLQ